LELAEDVLLVQQHTATLTQYLTASCPHIMGCSTRQTRWW